LSRDGSYEKKEPNPPKMSTHSAADMFFCGLMGFATAGHLFGTITLTKFPSGLFVWSLSGVLASSLVVALNVLRLSRPKDKAVARIALVRGLR
jgi:hypothetical protein